MDDNQHLRRPVVCQECNWTGLSGHLLAGGRSPDLRCPSCTSPLIKYIIQTGTYDYIKRTYTFQPQVGKRVQHTVTGKLGTITREDRSQGHYVQVRFEGLGHSRPCHPMELKYVEEARKK